MQMFNKTEVRSRFYREIRVVHLVYLRKRKQADS